MKAQAIVAVLLAAASSMTPARWRHAYSASARTEAGQPSARADTAASMVLAAPKVMLASLSWMAGSWSGTVDGSPMEEICSRPTKRLMMCMFRVFDDNTTLEIELRTFRQQADGLEERIRFLSPDSGSLPPVEAALALRTAASGAMVFENLHGSRPTRVTITRVNLGTMTETIDMIGDDGKPQVIKARYVKRAMASH